MLRIEEAVIMLKYYSTGGLQYGRKDLLKYLGMGAGGGGGGASAFPSPRAGRGGNGGGIVYLRLGKLKLDGRIVANGNY